MSSISAPPEPTTGSGSPASSWNPKQVGSNACGYFALANAVNALGNEHVAPDTLMKKDGARVNKLEFNAVLEGSRLSDQYQVVIPYDPSSAEDKPRLIRAALDGDDRVFIGQYRATIRTPDAEGRITTTTDYHYAMLQRSDTQASDKDLQVFKIKCSAAGKERNGMAMAMDYRLTSGRQEIDLSLHDVLAVRRRAVETTKSAATPAPKKGVLAWLKGALCCCCCVDAD